MNQSLGIIISFSTNELCFLDALLRETSLISNDIVISYGNKFFNGDDQDLSFLNGYEKKYPKVKFVEYKVDINLNKEFRKGVVRRPIAYFHNLSRYSAIQHLNKDTEWVLILDGDEIPEGNKFNELYSSFFLQLDHCYKITCFWYFKEIEYQAKSYEDSPLLIEKKYLTEKNIFSDDERDGIYKDINYCHRDVRNKDNLPVIHHYSFVRKCKEGLKKKIQNWGHTDDIFNSIDPDQFINYIYKNNNVNDIVHNYSYVKVENIFNI